MKNHTPITTNAAHFVDKPRRITKRQLLLLLTGPLACCLLLLLPTPTGLSVQAWHLVALITWMIIWWMTEATPVPVTALLPIPMMPLLDIAPQKTVTSSYGHPLIFLFLGGFLIASAMQRWGLHKRIALSIVNLVGSTPQRMIGGFMLATAFLSMWISNTATAVMMFAVAISIIELTSENTNDEQASHTFAVALLLGIAYSASIGGVGTLIGTPPNTLLASFMADSYDLQIDFSTWMMVGVPLVFIMLPITWLLLCKVVFPLPQNTLLKDSGFVREELSALGPMKTAEKTVAVVFAITALLWITRKWLVAWTGLNITDTSIAMLSALILFIIPASMEKAEFTLDWGVTKNLPWGVLFLFGGGLSLAAGFKSTGLAIAIGDAVAGLGAVDISIYILVVVASIIFLTEITSNTATTATFLPILGAVAVGLGVSPLTLAIPAALSASMAFMMPVATPPNAIVFSYDKLKIVDMVKAGIWLNIITICLVYTAMHSLVPWVFQLNT